MNFTSQICTTKEQSERLLALGLKKETADMHHYQYTDGGRWNIEARPSIAGYTNRLIPAWSLHRLMEIAGVHYFEFWWHEGIYEQVISLIEERIEELLINSKYLEDRYDKRKRESARL